MPRSAGALAILFVVASLALAEPAPETAQDVVTVKVTCPTEAGGKVVVSVDPWVYERDQDQDGEWVLENPSNDEIDIEPKASNKWPWKVKEKKEKKKVKTKEMKPGQSKKSFAYNITARCGEESIVIDPRVRVR